MPNNRLILLLSLISLLLHSCTSDSNDRVLELNSPISTRLDTTAYGELQYQVDISVNSGSIQTYSIDPNETSIPVIIEGVRVNEQNSIDILWQVNIDSRNVELSNQSQTFFADANTVIDAPHNHEEYDFDNDGASNLFELVAGTCIWSGSATDTCIFPESTDNIFLNGNFNAGTEQWWSTAAPEANSDGEYCVTSSATALRPENSHFGYTNRFPLDQNSLYTLSFDVRAQTPSTIVASVNLPRSDTNFVEVFVSNVEVFSTNNRYNYLFETENLDYNQTSFVFNIGTGMDNLYCFDNLVLEKVVEE